MSAYFSQRRKNFHAAVQEAELEDAGEMLRILVDGKRLRDISDLPLDLAV